jgi:hypothetical protein
VSDYDPVNQTVLADDGEPMSVFEIDSCPACGGYLTHWIGGDGPDLAVCLEATCDFVAERRAS